MNLAVFGLTISSSWGNGHATLWRGLCRALGADGHTVTFFERDVPYYATTRDYTEIPDGRLVLYKGWEDVRTEVHRVLLDCQAAIVTSYCPDAIAATDMVLESSATHVFYDMDTPVTLGRLARGEDVPYIGERGLSDFDLVLSYTGGRALDLLQEYLGARRVAALYGHADPGTHRHVPNEQRYRSDLSYLGTYAEDRQTALETLFVEPARTCRDLRFVIGGAQYPKDFPWSDNIFFVRHLAPTEHPAFFSSSRVTLNITRRDMVALGWCPSGRLFEAALCGTPLVSDDWEGLDAFFEVGKEILVANSAADVISMVRRPDAELQRMARRAYERVRAQHTSAHRARELISLLAAPVGEVAVTAMTEARV